MVEEVIRWLAPVPGHRIVDGTLGGGGHALSLAERIQPGGKLLAIDRDPEAIERCMARFPSGADVILKQANYSRMGELIAGTFQTGVHGILVDLGISSDQLDDPSRGFSFKRDGPLDMRIDPTSGQPAWKILETWSADRLADALFQLADERRSRWIARRIVETRKTHPIRTTQDLARLVERTISRKGRSRIHPATRTFMALRILVNDEFSSLDRFLETAPNYLVPGGTLVVIAWHSGEDRRVKQAFRAYGGTDEYELPLKKPLRAGKEERSGNRRARSACLRVLRRMA